METQEQTTPKQRKLHVSKSKAPEGTIAYKLRELRLSKGMSQRQLAMAANLSSPTISMFEGGTGDNMNLKSLKKLAGAYSLTTSGLLAEIGE